MYQGVHRDWSSALYRFLHVAKLLLDAPEPLLPRPLPYFLLDEPITLVVPAKSLLIAILSGGFARIKLPNLASLSFSICFLRRVEVLFSSGNSVLAFPGMSHLLRALYLPSELLQFSQQALISETERLHLIRISLYSFWCTSGRSAIYVALLVLHP